MKTINLLPHESSALAAGKLGVLIRVVEPQPRKGHIPTEDIGQWWPLYPTSAGMMQWVADGALICPFGPPGTVLECREEWAETESEGGPVMAYRAGGYLMIGATGSKKAGTWQESTFPGNAGEVYPPEEWRSADSMPSWVIRFRPVVGEVRCVRWNDLTYNNIIDWGFWERVTDEQQTDSWHKHEVKQLAANLFNSIHGPGSWEANTWLWLATINREGE